MIVDLNLKGRQVAVAGAGREATKKIEALLPQNCELFVHADHFSEQVVRWQQEGRVEVIPGRLSGGEFLKGYDRLILALAATNDKALNRKVVEDAKKLRCYAYAVDDPEVSDFNHPSIMNFHDAVQVAISTGGKSPLMAKTLRQKIQPVLENCIQPEDILKIELQSRLRDKARGQLETPEERRRFLQSILEQEDINRFLGQDNLPAAEALALDRLKNFEETR